MTAITKDIMRAAKHLVQRRWAQGDDAVFDPDRQHGYCIASACVAACDAARIPGDQIPKDMVLLFKHANGRSEPRKMFSPSSTKPSRPAPRRWITHASRRNRRKRPTVPKTAVRHEQP